MSPGVEHVRARLREGLGVFRRSMPAQPEPAAQQRRAILEADAVRALGPADPQVKVPPVAKPSRVLSALLLNKGT